MWRKKLPAGWKVAQDSCGRVYWYNKKTGETSFSPPSVERQSERQSMRDSLSGPHSGREMEIGLPMNVRHEGHIGHGASGGFAMSFT